MLRARLATAAIAIPSLLLLIFVAPRWLFAGFVATIAVLGVVEYAAMVLSTRTRGDRWAVVVGGVLIAVTASLPPHGKWVAGGVVATIIGGLMWVVAVRDDFERGLSDLGVSLLGILWVGLLLPHFTWIHATGEGPAWVTFIVAVAMAGDTGGYFVGRAFGRHKLTPRISPGKTVEGSLGIVGFAALGGLLACLVLTSLGAFRTVGLGEAVGIAFLLGVIGQIGDLSESVLKRSYGVKESGWIFPGHGGVLDRIDSLLFPACLVYYYIIVLRG